MPRKGLIGPWSHKFPHLGEPGPAIGYLQEVVRWWDHWLKDVDNGVMDGPMLQTWMQDSVPPVHLVRGAPGPVGRRTDLAVSARPPGSYPLTRDRIGVPAAGQAALGRCRDDAGSGEGRAMTVQSPLSVGQFAGKWASYNAPPDLPYDQREEDGGSLVFQTAPLDGARRDPRCPRRRGMEVSADAPVAQLNVRLSDVAPDGRSTRVTYGVLNLTHRDSEESSEALEPGRRYRPRYRSTASRRPSRPGHRIRLSLSTSYWPLVWPAPGPALLSVYEKASTLTLPVRPSTTVTGGQGPATPSGSPRATPPPPSPG